MQRELFALLMQGLSCGWFTAFFATRGGVLLIFLSKTFVALSALTGWQSHVLSNGSVFQFERLDFAQNKAPLCKGSCQPC